MIKHLTKSKEYILSSFSVQYLIMLNSVILHQALAKYGPQAQYGPSGFVIWPIDHCYKARHWPVRFYYSLWANDPKRLPNPGRHPYLHIQRLTQTIDKQTCPLIPHWVQILEDGFAFEHIFTAECQFHIWITGAYEDKDSSDRRRSARKDKNTNE